MNIHEAVTALGLLWRVICKGMWISQSRDFGAYLSIYLSIYLFSCMNHENNINLEKGEVRQDNKTLNTYYYYTNDDSEELLPSLYS